MRCRAASRREGDEPEGADRLNRNPGHAVFPDSGKPICGRLHGFETNCPR